MTRTTSYFYAILLAGLPGINLFAQDDGVTSLNIDSPRLKLSAKGKALFALDNTFGPQRLGERLFVTGIAQLRGDPYEWGGGTQGFAMRFGSRVAHVGIRNSIRLGVDVGLKIDPRYDPCECSGFKARTGHALRRVVMSRSDSGKEILGIDTFAGAYITPVIYHTWYPDRLNTTDRLLLEGSLSLGWHAVGNVVREFWPELRRGMPGWLKRD